MMSPAVALEAGVFDPAAVRSLWDKCKAKAESAQFSNTDNMAVVAVLSTHLVWQSLIQDLAIRPPPAEIRTLIDRVASPAA